MATGPATGLGPSPGATPRSRCCYAHAVSLLLLASVPLGVLGAWVAWRALAGRPLHHHTLNVLVGLLLLAYFAGTAGLGIFWVANQDLPIFDPHYLLGYLTLGLVAVHVLLNGPALLRFARRSPVLSGDGHALRPTVRSVTRVLLVAAVGAGGYWVGWSRGSTEISFVSAPGGASAPCVEPTTATTDGGAGATPPLRALAQERTVSERGQQLPLSRWYHQRSSHSRTVVLGRAPARAPVARPDAFERYPTTHTLALPKPPAPLSRATGALLRDTQLAPPTLVPRTLQLAELAALLHAAQGLTRVDGVAGSRYHKRAAASAGALYPIVVHLLVNRVEGLTPGLYHYAPLEHELRALAAPQGEDPRAALAAATARPDLVQASAVTVLLSAVYFKSSWKYGERGYRYSLLDAGHVAANLAAAAQFALQPRLIGRFDDARIAALLGLDLEAQGPLLLVPIGAPGRAEPPEQEPAFAPDTTSDTRAPPRGPSPASVGIMAAGTSLRTQGPSRRAPAQAKALSPRAPGPALALGAPAGDGDALDPVLLRRRSARRFSDAALERATLAALLARAPSPSVEGHGRLRRYLLANRVEGVAPGLYEVDDAGALRLLQAGALGDKLHTIALSQEVVRRAAALVIFSADTADLAWPDGSRGYRYAALDAGLYAGRLYLQGVALGVGVSSVGAFFDDELTRLLQTDESKELVLHLVALGHTR